MTQPPAVHVPGAVWVLLAISAVLFLWSLGRRRRRRGARRVGYWLWYAPESAVRRELAPFDAELEDLRPLAELLADGTDAEEDENAGLA